MSRKKKVGIAILALGLVVGYAVFDLLWDAGAFRTIEPVGAHERLIEGFSGGTEDFVLRPNARHLFVSSPNFLDPSVSGAIYRVEVASGELVDVTPKSFRKPGALQPHGVDLWWSPEGERLFVVNHPGGSALPGASGQGDQKQRHTVEIFDVAPEGTLTHLETVEHEAMHSPNDVAAVGPESFYVTNDHGYPSGFMRTVEEYLRLPAGNVLYVDSSGAREVYSGTLYANGIQNAPNSNRIYLAESTRKSVTWFERDPETNDLEFISRHETDTAVDNLDVDADGRVWLAGHPKMFTFLAHAKDPKNVRAPSHVIVLEPSKSGWKDETVYLSNGDPLSSSATALVVGDSVVVGSVFDPRLLVFDKP